MTTWMRQLTAVALVLGLLVVAPPATPAVNAQTPTFVAEKTAPGEVLAGESITYTIGARNDSTTVGDDLFNLTFRDVLPLGVTYASTTDPAGLGDPQIIVNDVIEPTSGDTVQQQTLIWSNVSDLLATDSASITFTVDVNTTGAADRDDVHVVGAVIPNTAEAYASDLPRVLPVFDDTGAPVADPDVLAVSSPTASTTLTAIEVTKTSDQAPEGEFLRGVHDHVITYTIEARTTTLGGSDAITVIDLIPAAMEFLGCGAEDNGTSGPGGTPQPEYSGAPLLSATPAVPDCVDPVRVETVESPVLGGVTYPGVYTLVEWPLGDRTAGETVTLPYAAGIPLFENTTTWATGATPATDGPQGSNLDNNNGPSTRETTSESSVVNVVRGQGDFTDGDLLEPGVPSEVFDEDTLSRTVEDLRIRKELVAPVNGQFQPGTEARYRIIVETSEYMSASGVVLTDDIPNGLCPKPQQGFTYSVNEPACLAPSAGLPTVDFASVTPDVADGGFDVVFAPLRNMTENDQVVVDYAAFMRGSYENGEFNGQPTVSGDSFVNEVTATGTTTGIPEIQAPGFRPPGIPAPTPVPDVGAALPGVGDDSQASLDTGTLSIEKQILPRNVTPRLDVGDLPIDRCPDPSGNQYIDSPGPLTPADAEALGFRLGDQICFRLTVDFDDTIFTRNALLTDFIPPGTEFVAGSLRATSANTVNFNVSSSPAAGPLVIELGTDQTGGRFVNFPNQVFDAVFLVEVGEAAPPARPLLLGNLMKLRTENSAGQAQSFRKEADFAIIPPPPITTVKGVAEVDDPPNGPNGANSDVDGVEVRQDSRVTFRIDLTNDGVPENFDNYSAREVEVVDRLPVQFSCVDVDDATILNFGPDTGLGECLDPGETSSDTEFTNDFETPDGTDISVIRWAFDISDDYALWPAGDPDTPPGAGGTRSLFYTVVIPTPSAAGERFDNEAGVRTYGGFTNLQGVTSPGLVPENNIDPALESFENAPQSDDDSFVFLPDVDVEKFVRTWIVEDNNNASSPPPPAGEPTTINGTSGQSVVGEYVTYRYYVDIPAETSVFEAELIDLPPTNSFAFVPDPPAGSNGALPSQARFYADASDPGFTTTLPAPVTYERDVGRVDFGAEYVNDTAFTQRFEVIISAITTEAGLGATNQPTRSNRVEFDSEDSLGEPIDPVADTASVQIRQPIPVLGKSVAPRDQVLGGETLTYTLSPENVNLSNPSQPRPPLHDSWVTDCIPDGLENVTILDPQPTDIGPLPGNPDSNSADFNGCPLGSTYVAFFFGTIENGDTPSRSYTVEVSTQSVGNQTYTNTAELTGSSLNDGIAGKPTPQSPDNPDERSYSDGDTETVRVLGAGAFKTVDPGQATIGETVEFTIVVSIPQNTQFFQAAVRDRLPVGLVDPQFVSADCFELPVPLPDPLPPTPPTCTVPPITTLGPELDGGANVYAIYVGDIPADPSIRTLVLRYTARVDDVPANVDGVDLVNTAQAVWDSEDFADDPTTPLYPWQEEGVENEATVEVIEPDLDITKVASDTTPEPGQNFGYTITVTNNGRSPAYDVVIVDTIPDGIEVRTGALFPFSPNRGGVVSGTPFNDQTITWTETDPLQPGDSIDLTYTARLAPSADIGTSTPAAEFTNTAQVTQYRSLPEDANNPDIRDYVGDPVDEVVEPQFPELDVTKDVLTPPPAYLGEPVTWRITVENTGGAEAFSVDVVDVLPRGWEYETGSTIIERPGIDLDRDPDITTVNETQRLDWPNLGSLEPGESLTVTFRAVATNVVVEPPPFAGGSVPQVNDASAFALDNSGAAGNVDGAYTDDDDAQTRVDAADVVIEKNNALTPAVAGEDYTWEVIVSNDGPDTAVGPFVVTDTLPVITPDPATFVSATGAGWTCSEAAATVSCTRTNPNETLASGAEFPAIAVTVAIPSDYLGDLTNAADVTSRTYDEDLNNNSADATVSVTDEADLEIEKNRVETDIVAGRTVTYTLDVTNNGPSTSRETITVVDTLPANTTFVSASNAGDGDPWDCVEAPAGTVTCTLLEGNAGRAEADLLANTAAPQIAITVLVDADAPVGVDITNTAEVVPGATDDPDLSNNTDTDVGAPNAVADLAIDKQATGELVAGQPATYRLRVDNFGPSDAAAPVITDTLPTGLTYVSFVSNPVTGGVGTWACTPGAGNTSFECVLDGPMPVGEFAVVDVTVDVDPNVTGTIVNTARVDSTTPDPVPDNNEDDDSSPFGVEADLTIVKTAPTDPVVAGTTFQYTLQVTNLGPSTSVTPITVTDGLPAGVEYLGYNDGGDWTCSAVPAAQPGFSFIVTCVLGVNLDPSVNGGAAPPIVLDVRAQPGAGPATLDNIAAVQGTTNDPNLDNNVDDAPVTLIDEVDVQVVKTPETQTVRAGESATFTLQVTNNGPSTADNVIVTDTLPSGMTLDPFVATPWDCTIGVTSFSCRLPELAPGDAAPITFTAPVGAGVPDGTTLTNTTAVTTSSPDTDPSNDDDTADVVVAAEADLVLTKSHDTDPVLAGGDVVFTIEVENLGPGDAVADVVVVDTLPAGFAYVSVAGPWTCVPDSVDPQEIECTFLGGGLAAGVEAGDLVMTVAVNSDVAPGTYDNVATVSSPSTDPNPDNNTDTDPVDVGVFADVSIVKTHDPATVMVGEQLVFTLAVSNAGPSDAQDVVVTDTIPAGLEFVSAAGVDGASTWDCSASAAPDVSCALSGPLPAGTDAELIEVTVLVLADAYPGVENTAVVESTTPDPDDSNNSSTDPVVVPPLTDLSITKEHTGDIQVGGQIEYTIVVTNNGPTPDPGVVTITDDLPTSLAPVSAAGDGLTCAIDVQVVTCTVDDVLEVDASVTLTIVADVLPEAYPEVTNVVTVATESTETDLTNNEATDTTPVAPLIELAVVKTLEEITVGAATWAITVANLGPNDTIEPIVLTDDLPVGLTFVSITGDGWVCTTTGQLVECSYDAVLVAGDSAPSLTLETVVTAPPGTEIVNSVTVTGGGPDVSEVTDSATGTVPPPLPATGGNARQPINLALLLLAVGLMLRLVAWARPPRRSAGT